MSAPAQAGLPLGQILIGDARTKLAGLPAASVDTVITSPPYFALRDYGRQRQLGLEADVSRWATELMLVCRELARILKPSGALWLNVGDSYSSHLRQGAPKKGLLLGPQRLAIALQEDGWIIRNQIIWAKTNPTPSSVGDRLSCTYEVMLLCVRSPRYFFDLDAIRRPLMTTVKKRRRASEYRYLPDSAIPTDNGFDDDSGLSKLKAEGRAGHPLGANPGDVWRLPTAAFHGAHFATFPLSLVEGPLLATCPERVCANCGVPWRRETVDRSQAKPTMGKLRPGCDCNTATEPGVVLDPFMGSGTVAMAAEAYGRHWVGIELNAAYAAMARQRLAARRQQQR